MERAWIAGVTGTSLLNLDKVLEQSVSQDETVSRGGEEDCIILTPRSHLEERNPK